MGDTRETTTQGRKGEVVHFASVEVFRRGIITRPLMTKEARRNEGEKSGELPVSVPRIVTAFYIPPRWPCSTAPKLPDDGDFPKSALGSDGGARFGAVAALSKLLNVTKMWFEIRTSERSGTKAARRFSSSSHLPFRPLRRQSHPRASEARRPRTRRKGQKSGARLMSMSREER